MVRYLTLDPPEHGVLAQALIEGPDDFVIPSVALAEAAFVLTRLYEVERATCIDLLVDLLGRANLAPLELSKPRALEALLLCRASSRVSFADALIWAAAREPGPGLLYTFDQRFPAAQIERRLLVAGT